MYLQAPLVCLSHPINIAELGDILFETTPVRTTMHQKGQLKLYRELRTPKDNAHTHTLQRKDPQRCTAYYDKGLKDFIRCQGGW